MATELAKAIVLECCFMGWLSHGALRWARMGFAVDRSREAAMLAWFGTGWRERWKQNARTNDVALRCAFMVAT